MNTHPAVELRDVSVYRGGRLLLDIPAFEIARNATLAVIGPNGAGKSTLMRVLALLDRPTKGSVFHEGSEVTYRKGMVDQRRRLALIMQRPFLRNSSVRENVATGLRFRRLPGKEINRRVDFWLNKLGISELGEQNARTLSGGEAQRVNIARGLVLEPELLLLDEPFSGLDRPYRLTLLDDLWGILNDIQTTTVFVTHDLGEAHALSQNVAVLLEGRIEQIDSFDAVTTAPASEQVANFVGIENIVTGIVEAISDGLSDVKIGTGSVTVVGEYFEGEELVMGINPDAVVLELPSADVPATSERNRLHGNVSRVVKMGAQARIIADCGFPLVSLVTGRSAAEMNLVSGKPMVASFKAGAIHVIRRGRSQSGPS